MDAEPSILIILSVITLVVFFIMSSNINALKKSLEYFKRSKIAEVMNNENKETVSCSNCKAKYYAITPGNSVCPGCNSINYSNKVKEHVKE